VDCLHKISLLLSLKDVNQIPRTASHGTTKGAEARFCSDLINDNPSLWSGMAFSTIETWIKKVQTSAEELYKDSICTIEGHKYGGVNLFNKNLGLKKVETTAQQLLIIESSLLRLGQKILDHENDKMTDQNRNREDAMSKAVDETSEKKR
jgi:hypothetical protein